MKHILLATTALVATAGVASAEIALSGSAEMGIAGGEHTETQFHTDIDVTFTMTGESDNGLTFGASIDLDESNDTDAFGASTQGGETIFIAYGPAKLTMGDVDGAFDAAMQEAIIGSSIGDNHEHIGYNGNGGLDGAYDGQIAQFAYSASGFTGYLSVELDDAGWLDASDDEEYGSPIWGVGVKYTADLGGTALNIGLGYQSGDEDHAERQYGSIFDTVGAEIDSEDTLSDVIGDLGAAARSSVWGLSLGTTFNNGIQAIFNYSVAEYAEANNGGDLAEFTGNSESHWGLAFGYSMNALTVGVNYGEYENFLGLEDLKASGWGLAADYDLGGGLSAQFGYGDSKIELDGDSIDDSTWSLGLAMSF
ncbi:porin [uncultured Pelagimonas sp.]|uniref:porin n=1 Tax=uncultured Pelagimonas sp. TaxID=1618102 RepID=UPI00260507C6|nr:porin [uncultured Pelagimonas sp.]